MIIRLFCLSCLIPITSLGLAETIADLQSRAIAANRCKAVHWGRVEDRYSSWKTHTNRLIPVYTYGTKGGGAGIDLTSYTGSRSVYRDKQRLERLYLGDVENTLCPDAPYMDQTEVYELQRAALEAGRKYIFVVVFDGMDWQTTRAASICNLHRVAYDKGRGIGTYFQEYLANGTTQYAWMATSPYCDGAQVDVNAQRVHNPGAGLAGGYCARLGGYFPWSKPSVPEYLTAGPQGASIRHAYTDSASSATSVFCGVKTYNGAVGVGPQGRPRVSIAHLAQARGYRVGIVTNVPFSHATPAAAYAHNVARDDFQDLSRDLLGLSSVSHPQEPLRGVDVLIGAGYGVEEQTDKGQGDNFVPGNKYLASGDLRAIDIANGGCYVVAQRTEGVPGGSGLMQAARNAAAQQARLFGIYGVFRGGNHDVGHLPFAAADGDFHPAPGISRTPIDYSEADILENPTLAEMTDAALAAVSADDAPFWLMVEAGDVDWANHENNLDASIGAVNSGDEAVKAIAQWVQQHSNWDESLMIVTADHGHYLVIDHPELLAGSDAPATHEGSTVDPSAAASQ